jgi:hypothetical protein
VGRRRSSHDQYHGSERQLEAHLFEPLYFSGNIAKVVISTSDQIDGRRPTPQEWLNIQNNAGAFARKNGAQLVSID